MDEKRLSEIERKHKETEGRLSRLISSYQSSLSADVKWLITELRKAWGVGGEQSNYKNLRDALKEIRSEINRRAFGGPYNSDEEFRNAQTLLNNLPQAIFNLVEKALNHTPDSGQELCECGHMLVTGEDNCPNCQKPETSKNPCENCDYNEIRAALANLRAQRYVSEEELNEPMTDFSTTQTPSPKCKACGDRKSVRSGYGTTRKPCTECQKKEEDPLIIVCNACSRACCWQGIFMCDDAQTAGNKPIPKSVLTELALESPHYWEPKDVKPKE
jgi:hypothetical protein